MKSFSAFPVGEFGLSISAISRVLTEVPKRGPLSNSGKEGATSSVLLFSPSGFCLFSDASPLLRKRLEVLRPKKPTGLLEIRRHPQGLLAVELSLSFKITELSGIERLIERRRKPFSPKTSLLVQPFFVLSSTLKCTPCGRWQD